MDQIVGTALLVDWKVKRIATLYVVFGTTDNRRYIDSLRVIDADTETPEAGCWSARISQGTIRGYPSGEREPSKWNAWTVKFVHYTQEWAVELHTNSANELLRFLNPEIFPDHERQNQNC